ncbi:TerC family protein [Paenibacillus monticola]|uniref:YjbE family putative metal transport protein n=1 Tax=Paenibacillus monticola TaxID=2666075 RepID=A0A7X2H8Y2_9BACL|nr:TerC family protein [Paenibacillus monticola]MRN55694.1 YjbE family putative metal transport protein [Paenibacillus monticola]
MSTSVWEFILSLLNIVFLDLILAGDNAIVIGLAARNLAADTQKNAVLLGTAGAVTLRIIATILVVWLLKVPWLLLAGGFLLMIIAYKLLTDQNNEADIKAEGNLWSAVRTIIIADAAMGLDNVIAVAGAAKHNITLVVLGLLISVPIVVWGSTLFIKLINKFPWIIYIGSAVLGFTASSMIAEEERIEPFFEQYPILRYLFIAAVIAGILAAGLHKRHSGHNKTPTGGIVS